MRKFSVYVDESGQDTKGNLFIVGILIVDGEKTKLLADLENIERQSEKKNLKWRKSRHISKKKYIEMLFDLSYLQEVIFFGEFHDSGEYIHLTSFATAKAILKKAKKDEYKASVFVDGFKKKEIEIFSRGLRDLRIRTRKIRGVKKDENNPFIRLADSLCGLVRDANDGKKWAKESVDILMKKKLIIKL
ncbi:MAG: hypothetical protein COZ27_01485 [Candidatus Moranbacteria bacterium CG_4_10_14_3_um_filter_41_65]|nr:MAG: hypothetical protein COW50_02610 [Candidatus Moranbacteria bacterium CG17_big_fil_post_rev_8_21_14_2_50_41_107]PIX91696.1 MAG: hypothetical protein COZ27_01485 [Candidatus Moranbacteria bacterium CG_4_10_14_3_um_filter_41_65]